MKLHEVQQKLKAPKSQYNLFGKYYYRNAEDILEAVKPLLGDSILTLSDEVVQIGERYYVKATASLTHTAEATELTAEHRETLTVTAFAREAFDRKGMDDSQITGAASSYARKYALNGLFLIDDTKDADSDAPKEDVKPAQTRQTAQGRKPFEQPKKDAAVAEEAAKDRIRTLLGKLELPNKTVKQTADSVFTATGLLLAPENYEQIGDALAKELDANK